MYSRSAIYPNDILLKYIEIKKKGNVITFEAFDKCHVVYMNVVNERILNLKMYFFFLVRKSMYFPRKLWVYKNLSIHLLLYDDQSYVSITLIPDIPLMCN